MNVSKRVLIAVGFAVLLCAAACQSSSENKPSAENQPRAAHNGSEQQAVLASASQQQEKSVSPDSTDCPTKGNPLTLHPDTSDYPSSGRRGVVYELDSDIDFGIAEPAWRGDLNEDGISDLILIFVEACSSWGECPEGVYAGCSSRGKYVNIYEPDYTVGLRMQDSSSVTKGKWPKLVKEVRRGRRTEDRLLVFDGNEYHEVEEE